MAYGPLNARSELVLSTKSLDGGVFDIRRMFHAAWPASATPALSPTRGSGLGADIDMLLSGEAPLDPEADMPGWAHAPADKSTIASDMRDVGRLPALRA